MTNTDVLVVGAGPTGLALACQLIRHGVDFVIVDTKEDTTPFSRAIGVQARTLEIYEQIGLADNLIKLGHPAEKVRMIEGGVLRGEAELTNIGAGMSPYPFLLIVEQGKHEKLLYQFIKDSGRDVRWQHELVSFDQNENGVSAHVRTSAGDEIVTAKYLVGCDGSKSPVRHSLGLTFEGDTVSRLFYVADVQIDWEFPHDALQVCLAKHTITAFFPMAGANRYRIVGTFPEGHEGEEGDVLYEEIERQIALDTEMKLEISHVNWFSTYKVHSRAVNSFSAGRCFVAGDAAHIHTPAGAQGMNTGIQDGYNLAWKLALAIHHGAEQLLNTYNEERLPNAKRLLKTTDRFFEFGATDEWFVSFFRTRIFPYILGFALSLDIVKKAIFPLVSQIGISYRKSSLSRDNADLNVRAGDRMPYFQIDGRSIYDRLHAPKFHQLTFGVDDPLPIDDAYRDIVDEHHFALTDEVKDHFRATEPFVLLLRADNYIGLISTDLDARAVSEYLKNILS